MARAKYHDNLKILLVSTMARAGAIWDIVLNIRREDLRPSLFDLRMRIGSKQHNVKVPASLLPVFYFPP